MNSKLNRGRIVDRAGGRCEAILDDGRKEYRCFRAPVEVHHMLTRARGGKLLDEVGETYHLIALCSEHHRMADGASAYEGGLLIDGYVTKASGVLVYQGSDEYLRSKYANVART